MRDKQGGLGLVRQGAVGEGGGMPGSRATKDRAEGRDRAKGKAKDRAKGRAKDKAKDIVKGRDRAKGRDRTKGKAKDRTKGLIKDKTKGSVHLKGEETFSSTWGLLKVNCKGTQVDLA